MSELIAPLLFKIWLKTYYRGKPSIECGLWDSQLNEGKRVPKKRRFLGSIERVFFSVITGKSVLKMPPPPGSLVELGMYRDQPCAIGPVGLYTLGDCIPLHIFTHRRSSADARAGTAGKEEGNSGSACVCFPSPPVRPCCHTSHSGQYSQHFLCAQCNSSC